MTTFEVGSMAEWAAAVAAAARASTTAPDRMLTFETLPPGAYVVESPPKNSHSKGAWNRKQPVSSLEGYRPLLDARAWGIERMTFTDSTGTRWAWTPKGSFAELAQPAAPRRERWRSQRPSANVDRSTSQFRAKSGPAEIHASPVARSPHSRVG